MTLCSRGRSGFRRTLVRGLVRGLVAMSLIAATPLDRGLYFCTFGTVRAIRGKLCRARQRRATIALRRAASSLMLALEILPRIVGHECSGDEADEGADSDVGGDGIGRLVAAV